MGNILNKIRKFFDNVNCLSSCCNVETDIDIDLDLDNDGNPIHIEIHHGHVDIDVPNKIS